MDPIASEAGMAAAPAEVVVLQASAIVDHVCAVDEATLSELVNEETGGSRRATVEDLTSILSNVGEFNSKAGGSAANTARGLASGAGILKLAQFCVLE